ncbi:hypothetical protein [Desulfosporosinus sp. SB140]|uniref:hypothetical protein n=1 Tax=Desulfosporosinus paludis TaxID=3115649 RepID=UPI00388D055E
MSTLTTNLNLVKPALTDNADITVINTNMDLIDAAIATKETPIGAQAKANTAETNSKGYTDTKIAALVAAAPGALDTLKELSDALGDDPNFATTMTNLIASKADQTTVTAHLADNVNHVPYSAATGAANTYIVALNPAPTSYVDGIAVAIKINVNSTGASTLNVNGLGAKTILDSLGNAITSGGLKAGIIYSMRYNSTTGNFIVQGKGGGGNATAAQLLNGATATVDIGQITGTMPSKSAQTYTPGTAAQTIAAGEYLSGAQTIAGDANLVTSNIKKGISIFGVSGKSTVVDVSDTTVDTVGHVLNGLNFYGSDGNKYAGSMPNHSSADSPANSIAGTGAGRIYVRPQAGYYDGSVASYVDDGNFQPYNIVFGTSILGIAGSAIPQNFYSSKVSALVQNATITPIQVISVAGPGTLDWANTYFSVSGAISSVMDIYIDGTLFTTFGANGAGIYSYLYGEGGGSTPTTVNIRFTTSLVVNLYKNNSTAGTASGQVGYSN